MIYAIQAGEDGPIKFGVAGNPANRLRELQTGNPLKLRILSAADIHNQMECLIHYHLRADRLNGEWFKPSISAWGVVWAIERQSFYEEAHELGDFILENDPEAVSWYRNRMAPR